jgi:hypothetical protein
MFLNVCNHVGAYIITTFALKLQLRASLFLLSLIV